MNKFKFRAADKSLARPPPGDYWSNSRANLGRPLDFG